jgi:hypothetical protein
MKIRLLILCEEITAVFSVTLYKIQIRHVGKMMNIKGLNSRAVSLFQYKQKLNLNNI